MKAFIQKIILASVIIYLLIILFNSIFRTNYQHYTYHMMEEMYQNENIDVLFLGSSHVYRSYDPKIADEILECKTFNAGSSGQGMNTSYYLLKEISLYHNVKTVYLDTFFGIANLPENDAQCFPITDFMKGIENKYKLLWSNGGIETVINSFMYFRRSYAEIDFKYLFKKLDVTDYSTVSFGIEEYRGRGFVYSYKVANEEQESIFSTVAETVDFSNDSRPVSNLYYKYLKKIIDFCEKQKIELVLVNQPMPRRTINYVKGYNNYIRFLTEISKLNGIDYYNFDLYKFDTGLDIKKYTDGEHLNGLGAEIYTNFFCNFIKDVKNKKITPRDMFFEEYHVSSTLISN